MFRISNGLLKTIFGRMSRKMKPKRWMRRLRGRRKRSRWTLVLIG